MLDETVTAQPFPPLAPPAPTYLPPKPKFPLLPLLFGFFIVIILAGVFGVVYYKNKLTVSSSPSPSPVGANYYSPAPSPSEEPSSSPSAMPHSSVKPTAKPVSVIKSVASPIATPTPGPTLDILFGNPSVNVKQTIDEGAGDGRVINREYTSIQTGQFDEVSSSWSPRVTVCFHLVSNQEIKGSDLQFTYTLDGNVVTQDTLAQYDKLEAGRLYDWCHDTTNDLGSHTAKLLINPGKSLTEYNYANDLARVDWINLADKIAPNYTLIGPNDEGDSGTCLYPQYISDNVSAYANLKIQQKVDSADWTTFTGDRYCFVGTFGSTHTYATRITDERGNANEQTKTFALY